MKLTNLSSGSKGNCTFIAGNNTNILVDIGVNTKYLTNSLQTLGYTLADINAVLITHEHTDHICGLACFAKKYPDVHIYVYNEVWQKIVYKYAELKNLTNVHYFTYDTTFSVGEFTAVAMQNFHDSASCASFIISEGQSKVGICTDLGIITDYQINMLSLCKVVMLESNHDPEMLSNCGYPKILKERIAGTYGHLSNSVCANSAVKMLQKNTKVIMLSHISENSNLPEIAYTCMADAVQEAGITDIHIVLTFAKRISKTIIIK